MLRQIPRTPFTVHERRDNRVYVELDERVTGGVGIELELHLVGGRTVGAWLVSNTAAVLAVVKGARC